MNDYSYLLIYTNAPIDELEGAAERSAGVEIVTWQALVHSLLKQGGGRVFVAGDVVGGDRTKDGVEYLDIGLEKDITLAINRVRKESQAYHVIVIGRGADLSSIFSDERCLSCFVINHESQTATTLSSEEVSAALDCMARLSEPQKRVAKPVLIPLSEVMIASEEDFKIDFQGEVEEDFEEDLEEKTFLQDGGILLKESFEDDAETFFKGVPAIEEATEGASLETNIIESGATRGLEDNAEDKEDKISVSQISDSCDGEKKLKILMQNRGGTFTQRGGDTIVIEKLSEGLTKRGHEVVIDLDGSADPAKFDIVHLFNFVLPDFIEERAKAALAAGTPFVVTTLNEDLPSFHNQSITYANFLIHYVQYGQDRAWYSKNEPDLYEITPCSGNDNTFAVKNAALLFTTGQAENLILQRSYGDISNLCEIKLGHEIGEDVSPELFQEAYKLQDFILCVGRLESRKNQLMLLKALEDSNLPLVLVAGNVCYQPAYANAVKSFRRRGQTLILDYLSSEMLASAYAAAKVHVLPSWYELPGLVSLEAGARGCQVVVSDSGTTRDYLGDNAFYCDPDDERSIRVAVLSAYHASANEKIRDLCRSYNWEDAVLKTEAAYKKVCRGEGALVDEVVVENKEKNEMSTLGFDDNTAGTVPPPVTAGSYDCALGAVEFQEVLERGEMAARNKEYNIAHACLERAEKLNPLSARVFRARGAVFLAENNVTHAFECFNKALEIDANDARSWSGLGMCELHEGDLSEAYDHFVKALTLEGDQLVSILQLVECSYKLNRFDDLITILRKYIAEHSDNLDMRYCYAGALYKSGDFDNASSVVDEILNEDPTNLGAKQLRSAIDEAQQDLVQPTPVSMSAIEKKIAESVPEVDGISKHLRKLVALEELKRSHDYEKVLAGCDDILRVNGLTPQEREWSTLLKGEVFVLTGQSDTAAQIFADVLKDNPNSARALNGQGALAIAAGDWNKARESFQEAFEIEPSNDVALAGLGTCAVQQGDAEMAWRYYSKALSKNHENVRALLGSIELGYQLGKMDEVEKVIKNYLELHPASVDFIYSLAGCYFVQNRLQDATDQLEKIALLDPENARALELRGLIQERLMQ